MLTTEAGKKDTTARLVLVALAEKARGETPRAFPSMMTMRFTTGLDRRVIQRALGRLADAGLITACGKRGDVNVWRLNVAVKRPASDLEEIERELEEARAKDVARQQKARALRTQNPDTEDVSRTQNPLSRTQNPVSRTESPDVTDAEPPRTGKGAGDEPVESEPVPLERASVAAPAADALFDAKPINAKKAKPVDPLNAQAQELATGYYEAMAKMPAFMGVKKVVRHALGAGFTVDQIKAALHHMSTVDRQRPLTRQTLLAAIESPNGHATNGHRPFQNPADQSVYDQPLLPGAPR